MIDLMPGVFLFMLGAASVATAACMLSSQWSRIEGWND